MYKSLLAVIALGALGAGQLFAVDELSSRADRKITGQYYRPYTASTYYQGAIRHAEALNYYGRRYSTIPDETAQEHIAELRHNLKALRNELSKLAKEAKTNKILAAHLKTLEEHHAKAEELAKQLEEAPADAKTMAACCADIAKELKAAEAENEKLKKTLGIEDLPEKGK